MGQDKYAYNRWHPYISIIPIVGYVLVRNCHPILRRTHSSAMAWVGQFTLETYVLQFHIFMCHNVQHIIVFFPGFPVTNFLVVGAIFVGVSWVAREATIDIQKRVSKKMECVSKKMEKTSKYTPVATEEEKQMTSV